MSRHEDTVRIRHMLDYARETLALVQGRSRRDLDSDRVFSLVSCLSGSPNKSPGYGSLGKDCHPESLAPCHSEPFGPERTSRAGSAKGKNLGQSLRINFVKDLRSLRDSSPEPDLSSL